MATVEIVTTTRKMSKNPAILVKVKQGEHPEEIAAKLAQVPNEFWLTQVKRFTSEDGPIDVFIFVYWPEPTIDELLDGPLVCSFNSKIID